MSRITRAVSVGNGATAVLAALVIAWGAVGCGGSASTSGGSASTSGGSPSTSGGSASANRDSASTNGSVPADVRLGIERSLSDFYSGDPLRFCRSLTRADAEAVPGGCNAKTISVIDTPGFVKIVSQGDRATLVYRSAPFGNCLGQVARREHGAWHLAYEVEDLSVWSQCHPSAVRK